MRLLIILNLLFTSGCAIGPISSHEVGRSMGGGNHNLKTFSTHHGYYGVSYDVGVLDSLDLGLHWEVFSIGAKLKWAFINNRDKGFSMATILGYGSSIGGSYYTGSLVASYRGKVFEPFLSGRYTYVQSDSQSLGSENAGEIFITIPAFDYDYVQAFLGTKIWVAQWMALSLEAGSFISIGDVLFANNVYFSGAVEFEF